MRFPRPFRGTAALAIALALSQSLLLACASGKPGTATQPRGSSSRGARDGARSYEPSANQAQPARMEDLLQRVPGLTVLRDQGNGIRLRVRDIQSFTDLNEPLLMIDGMTVRRGGISQALSGLNPQDVARVEVVKDPGSLAFYGSAGVFGVVLITTRKGR